MKKQRDANASDPVSPGPLRASSAFTLVAAGGLLQTLAETLALGNGGALPAGASFVIFGSAALAVALYCAALWQSTQQHTAAAAQPQRVPGAYPARLKRLASSGLLVLLALAALWTVGVNGAMLIQHPLDPGVYDSDAAAFIQYQAEDVLRGINPYTDDSGFWHAALQFPHAGATPLRRGQFAQQSLSPDDATIADLLQSDAQNPGHAGPEFDPATLHSYPAGSFLLAVPFIWAGFSSTQPLYALCLLLLFVLLIRWSPPGWRWQTALLLVSLSIPIALTLRSSFEIICILCILGAWRAQERHPWVAAILLGLGCAVKQLTWLFLPFYLIWVLRQRGWRAAALAGAISALVFFAINAPFLLAAPAAWANSMLLPITEPAFPAGIGLITLSQGGLLPLFPAWIYTTLQIIAYLGALAWFSAHLWQTADRRASAAVGVWGLLLASLPLLPGSRSLISYTMFLPVLALAALLQQISSRQPIAAHAASHPSLVGSAIPPGAALSNE